MFSAALREQSLNSRLAWLAAQTIEEHGGAADLMGMAEFGAPPTTRTSRTASLFARGRGVLPSPHGASDTFMIASPEYNAVMPGLLKNAIDWVSRLRPQRFNERHGLLMSASPSVVSAATGGLWSLRIPLEHLGARVYPDMFSVAQEPRASTRSDAGRRRWARRAVHDHHRRVHGPRRGRSALPLHPCIKSAWIEFLGERPDPALDRVE